MLVVIHAVFLELKSWMSWSHLTGLCSDHDLSCARLIRDIHTSVCSLGSNEFIHLSVSVYFSFSTFTFPALLLCVRMMTLMMWEVYLLPQKSSTIFVPRRMIGDMLTLLHGRWPINISGVFLFVI